jgi:hypothetical protein
MKSRVEELVESFVDRVYGSDFQSKERERIVAESEIFFNKVFADVEDVIHKMYEAYPIEQAVVLLSLSEDLKDHFWGSTEDEDPGLCPRCGEAWSGTSCGANDCGWIACYNSES